MPLNYEQLMSMKFEPARHTYTRKDTMLYALGLGVGSRNQVAPGELKFVYERDLVALPTLAVVLAAGAMRLSDPRFGVNYGMLLHAEQSLLLHKPLPPEGTVISYNIIDEIYDKGATKGAIMYMTRKLHDEKTGELLVSLGTVTVARAKARPSPFPCRRIVRPM
jgi:hypothetical protein